VRTIGFKWKRIAPMMTERTLNHIKHRWYSVLAKRKLKYLGRDGEKMMKIRLQVRNNEFTEDITDIAWTTHPKN
jgi:hypothetical protein